MMYHVRSAKSAFQSAKILVRRSRTMSTHQPLATALSDVMSPTVFEQQQRTPLEESQLVYSPYRAHASALSDFMSPSEFEQRESALNDFVDDYEIPNRAFATALSDFTSPSEFEQKESEVIAQEYELPYRPFATALSDTMSPSEFEQKVSGSENESEWFETMSFASPESDFTAANDHEYWVHSLPTEDDDYQSSMAYSLAYASPESDFNSLPLTDEIRAQLRHADNNSLTHQEEEIKLPRSYHEYRNEANPEALVVTAASAPFQIVDVNGPWEKLCGFSLDECKGDTLNILQGPETDIAILTAMLSRVVDGSEEKASAEVINYDRNQRKFRNRLTMGPLKDDDGNVTHFVGMLQDLSRSSQNEHTTSMRM